MSGSALVADYRATVEFSGSSHPGRVRTLNEDAFHVGPGQGRQIIAIVADGMGGHKSGEVASQKAVAEVRRELERSRSQPPGTIGRAMQSANISEVGQSGEDPEHTGRGSTG